MGERRRDGGVNQEEAEGRKVCLGEICRSLSLDFNGDVAYKSFVCASVCVCGCKKVSPVSFSASLFFSPPFLPSSPPYFLPIVLH